MQKHPDLTRSRLTGFMAQSLIMNRLYARHTPVNLSVFSAPDRIPYTQAMKGQYRTASVGEKFGPLWSTHWFKVDIRIPSDWKGTEVHLRWDSSSEACVWRNGVPLQGLTGTRIPFGEQPPIRTEFVLTPCARGGERMTLYIEVACNQLIASDGLDQFLGLLRMAEIAVFERSLWDLILDFTVITEMATQLPPDTPRAAQALYAGNEMINQLTLDDRSTWQKARAVAAKYFRTRNGEGQHSISAIGHGHLDTAWLWPLAETKRKCYRTFSTALRYMETYPEYKFVCSQAQQYEWMKIEQPALYAQIQKRVKEQRFIPAGGAWVESDCNIPSGEALVRQFLFGQRFFQREFGITCRESWNPDAFGYNAQLPQILRGVGMSSFVSTKISWNQFNKPHRQTFWWEGIDGSRVLTHFPPADTYNGVCTVKQLLFNVSNYKDLERSNESLYIFGYGDGGGGPTMEMLERLRRARDVDGLPKIQIRTPQEALARIEKDAHDLTTQVGELYLEGHRGTYTTQARNKLNNRRSEDLLHDVEFLSSVAPGAYPVEELQHLWKLTLLNQFHDVIPGSSITEVHQESLAQYAEIISTGTVLRDRAIKQLGFNAGKRFVAINTLSEPRTEIVELSGPRHRLAIVTAPAMGYAIQEPQTVIEHSVTVLETKATIILENRFVRAVFQRDGTLSSLFDKRAARETIAGKANRFVLFGENNYDAWNVEVYHLEHRREAPGAKSAHIVMQDPLRAAIEFEYDISPRCHLRQEVSLSALSGRLDFACETEWHERNVFLKVEFPTTLRSDHATYEIQFGHVSRPTHFNSPYDLALFEVCAQRWVDLSEPGFGLALLNDCKYGHAVHGSTMRLSLLRSSKHPDAEADMGTHTFRYALLPHTGSFQEADIVHEARRFNVPLMLSRTNADCEVRSWFSPSSSGIVIDTVKKAEDSDALIVRLYESTGARSRTRLHSSLPVQSVTRCSMLEEEEKQLVWKNGSVSLELGPFQIVTLKMFCLRFGSVSGNFCDVVVG